jgi:hypothetical protein
MSSLKNSDIHTPDPRHLSHGRQIPTESYSDQPFVVRTDDGAWLCCVTTGPGHPKALPIPGGWMPSPPSFTAWIFRNRTPCPIGPQ